MEKVKTIIAGICLSICCSTILKAQQNTVATGGDIVGSGGSVSYTVGQIDFTYLSGAGGSLNQGVQQPYEITLTNVAEGNGSSGLSCDLYPNPTADFVVLSRKDDLSQSMSYRLLDMDGKVLMQENFIKAETNIPMGKLAAGTYYVRVISSKTEVKSFKIIKN